MSYTVKLPTHVEVAVDLFAIKDQDDFKKVKDYLKSYINTKGLKDWNGLKIEVSGIPDDQKIFITFDGEGVYKVYSGTPASWNDPGDPGEIDWPFETEDFADYIRGAIKEMPFDVSFEYFQGGKQVDDNIKSANFIKNGITIEDSNVPEDEREIYDAIDYPDEDDYPDYLYDESKILEAVLSGKSLTEALQTKPVKERAGDWDLEPEETLDASTRGKLEFEQELNSFRKKAKGDLLDFKVAVRKLSDVFKGCNDYDIPYYDAAGCPFKNLATLVHDCDEWIGNIAGMIDGGTKNGK